MSGIKFNQFTKEIELDGSESFIESNFNKIQDLLVESFGVKKMIVARKTKATQEPISFVKMQEVSEAASVSQATISTIPEISHEFKATRAPLRKYIRKVGIPGQQRTVVEVVEQKPRELSLSALKEKFGLSESKIGGIIRDAAKLGKLRKGMNGSYVWAKD